jgi:ABC-type amino acid transport system permease subunit
MSLFNVLSLDFLLDFLRGLTLNISASLILLVVVLPLAFGVAVAMNARFGFVARPTRAFIKLLHALPVFVVLFFMSGVLTPDSRVVTLFGGNLALMLLIIGNTPYVLAYGSDQFLVMLDRLQRGQRREALLIIPSIGRGLQMVMSTTCFGAALGVPEAMSVILFTAEQLPDEATQILFFAIAALMFVVVLRICLIPFKVLHMILDRRAAPAAEPAA